MRVPAAVGVVIPARDEEVLLPACLDAVDGAVSVLREEHPTILARVFVVLDACGDRSAEIVAGRPEVTAIVTQAGNVGVARALGVAAAADWALALGVGSGTGSLWVANTDSDSVVPRHWLRSQVRMAGEGRRLVAGNVVPRASDLTTEELEQWRARHSSADGHAHVHGANLGFTWDAYESVGGFAPIATHEDVELVGAMRRAGFDWIAAGDIAVTTSGRRVARAPGGFADYLEDMGA
ncbi:Glycosyltransferase like family 2 [Nocardioides alpinus]|uniref:4,4'-diaponeurosporenoate glycosyltransferase n=1 Tax=Nocardioides alpinus TaxID=748909 RepID=A0A1I1AYS1_9ACTN|nr:glycosyltransferase [Nocardioides alpinus]PKH40979.1 glycosyl transferase family 2 [Nocardioides alpinus]SFB42556.1 Glycosyltransferase like family 2 [Nocardioides alpinus]